MYFWQGLTVLIKYSVQSDLKVQAKQDTIHHMTHTISIPQTIATGFLYASSGKYHCLEWGQKTLRLLAEGQEELWPLAIEVLLAAFECDPTDANLATQILALSKKAKYALAPERLAMLSLCAQIKNSENLPSPAQAWQAAHVAWQEQDWQKTLTLLQPLFAYTPLAKERAGHCLARMGQVEAALELWKDVLTLRPWHTQLQLTMHDYALGLHTPLEAPLGPCAVLIYTWNKAQDVDALLASLFASKEDMALLVCLDNGSTDDTPQVLQRWQERYGKIMQVHTLPVNVGAPAARNWLAHLPEVQALPFAAYVDDDALLPPHWLRSLSRAMREYPEAHTWGCHIVDAGNVGISQCGPLHLEGNFIFEDALLQDFFATSAENPTLLAQDAFSPHLAKGEPFGVRHVLCMGELYDACTYIRPCASVTGCCHIFRTEDLLETGFNLSFSPSQRDDQHRDLMLLKKGKLACYTGFCTVEHQKRSGGGINTAPTYGNALGNVYKLHGQFSAQDIEAMLLHEIEALQCDLRRKQHALQALHLLT